MKAKQLIIVFFIMTLLWGQADSTQAEPVGSAFTYQGRLLMGPATTAHGNYHFRFTPFDASSGGTEKADPCETEVFVDHGLFNVELDYGETIFDGNAVYLEVKVSENISGPWTTLPRHKLTAIPYAFYVKNADKLDGYHENAFFRLSENVEATGFPSFNGGASGDTPPFYVDSTDKVTNLNADRLDGYHENAFFRLSEHEAVTGRPSFNGGTSGDTPPFYVDSTDKVTDLNADMLDGYHCLGSNNYIAKFDNTNDTLTDSSIHESGDTVYVTSDVNISGAVFTPGITTKIGNPLGGDRPVYLSNGELCVFDPNLSSLRYKDHIKPLQDNFYKILQAECKSFVYKSNGQSDIGFIAEEFDSLGLDSLVIYRDGRPDGIKYNLVPLYLLEVTKDQVELTSKLKAENESLKQRIEALERAIQQHQFVKVQEVNR